MKPRVWMLAAMAAVVLLFGFGLMRNSEPAYHGKSLAEWLDAAASPMLPTGEPANREWTRAIQHMGVPSLPYLVQHLDAEPWLNPQRLLSIRRMCPRFLQPTQFVLWLTRKAYQNEEKASARATAAAWAFKLLGPEAQPALADLMRRFTYPQHWFTVYRVGSALTELGPGALPSLLQVLADPRFTNQLAAVEVIGRMHDLPDHGASAVPVLCQCMRGADPTLQTACVRALGSFDLGTVNTAPGLVVPALTEVLTNSLRTGAITVSRKTAEVLGGFTKAATGAVPALCEALHSSDGITTEEAARALGRIGGPGELAVPALLRYFTQSERRHRKYAIEGLSGYSAMLAPEVIPLLREALMDPDHDTREAAAKLLAKMAAQ